MTLCYNLVLQLSEPSGITEAGGDNSTYSLKTYYYNLVRSFRVVNFSSILAASKITLKFTETEHLFSLLLMNAVVIDQIGLFYTALSIKYSWKFSRLVKLVSVYTLIFIKWRIILNNYTASLPSNLKFLLVIYTILVLVSL